MKNQSKVTPRFLREMLEMCINLFIKIEGALPCAAHCVKGSVDGINNGMEEGEQYAVSIPWE